MNRGISLIVLLLAVCTMLINTGCSDNVSGGVSEEANALFISGKVVDDDGLKIDSANVMLIPEGYIPGVENTISDSLITKTDSTGYFKILLEDTANYNVYVTHKNSSTIHWGQPSYDTAGLDLKLKSNGALRIVLPDTLDTINGEIFIEGSPFIVQVSNFRVDSKAGYAVLFSGLPSGFFDEVLFRDNPSDFAILDTEVYVPVNDTQTILSQNEFVLEAIDYTQLSIGNSGLPTNAVFSSFIGKKGVGWFATEKGVASYEIYDDTTWTVYNSSNTPMEADVINCVYYNSETDIVWLGLFGGGLARFDGTTWTTWTEDNSDIPHDNVTGIVYEPGRGLWLATDGGLALFDESNWTIFNSSETALLSDNITSIDIKNGTKWIASTGGSIASIDPSDNITVYDTGDEPILANSLYCIKVDQNSDAIWVGTQQGLLKYSSGVWESYGAGDWGNTESRVASIALDPSGILWIGTFSGLVSLDGSAWTDHSGYPGGQLSGKIEDIFIDLAGNKWCSLFSNGVVIFNSLL